MLKHGRFGRIYNLEEFIKEHSERCDNTEFILWDVTTGYKEYLCRECRSMYRVPTTDTEVFYAILRLLDCEISGFQCIAPSGMRI